MNLMPSARKRLEKEKRLAAAHMNLQLVGRAVLTSDYLKSSLSGTSDARIYDES